MRKMGFKVSELSQKESNQEEDDDDSSSSSSSSSDDEANRSHIPKNRRAGAGTKKPKKSLLDYA